MEQSKAKECGSRKASPDVLNRAVYVFMCVYVCMEICYTLRIPVFLNRRAAARYRALASIIPGRVMFSWNVTF